MTEQTKLSALDTMQWVGDRTAQYLNWKYKVHNNLPFDGKVYDRNKSYGDDDPYWPGMYVYGIRTCGFFTPDAIDSWKKAVTNPENITIIAGFGALTAKSSAPRDVSGNVLSELIIMFVTYTVLMALWMCITIVVDLLVMVPLMLFRMHQYSQWQNDHNQRENSERGLANIPFIEHQKLEMMKESF